MAAPSSVAARESERLPGGQADSTPAPGPTTEPLANTMRFAVAALSLGAAAIHFAVVSEHWQMWPLAGLFFAATGILQAAWALLVLHRPSRPVLALGAVAQLEVVALWVVSRTSGLPFGPEAHVPEAVGRADVLASAMEVLAALGAGLLLRPRTVRRRIARGTGLAATGGAAALAAGATTLALLPGGADSHGMVHVSGDVPAGWTAGCMHHVGGGHKAGACTNAPVTPEQRAAAEELRDQTVRIVTARYPTIEAAEADGYRLLNVDKFVVHLQRPDYQHDGHVLDPNRVESLVYVTYRGRSMLMGAMYIAEPTAPQGPLIGGALTSWHIHTNLCVDTSQGTALDAGPGGRCAAGSAVSPTAQMLHVWTMPYPGGPFADLTMRGAEQAQKVLKRHVDG